MEWLSSGIEWAKKGISASSQRPFGSPSLGPAGELGARGIGEGLCPHQGHPLAVRQPTVNLSSTPTSVKEWLWQSPWDSLWVRPRPYLPPSRFGRPEEPEGHWVLCTRLPQWWWLGKVWAPGPEGDATQFCFLLANIWTLEEEEEESWDLALVRTENNIYLTDLQEHGYLTMTWPPEQRIWHQEICNS